jgi:hypothetical protein
MAISNTQTKITEKKPLIKMSLNKEQLMERNMELVRGVFVYDEAPGAILSFSFHHYKNIGTKFYTFKDGETYKIPRCVAKHIANNGSYVIHEYQMDESGVPRVRIGRKKRRYHFESVDFFGDDESLNDEPSNIYTAEKIVELHI